LAFQWSCTVSRSGWQASTPPESRTRDKREKFYGKYATAWLKERIEGKVVTLRTELDGKGKFGRILAKVYFGRRFINNQMVEGSMAVAYHGQSKDLVKQQHKTNFMKLEEQGVKPE
jgi:endonuclease YncB( thermonuclease family)